MPHVDSTDGVRVAIYDFGGEGPPLLLSHATGFHAHVWTPAAGHLAKHFHCYAFDQRAHGDTKTPPGLDLAWEGLGDDVLAAVRGLALDRPFGVGHSSGAAALFLAEASGPGTFRALYCYEPVVLPFERPPGPPAMNPMAEATLKRRDVFPSKEAAYDNFAERGPFASFHPDALRAYVEYGFEDAPDGQGVRLRCRPEDEAQMYRMGSAHNAFARFPTIRCPVTIAHGGSTDAIGSAVAQAQAAALPDVRLEEVPDLGHLGPMQDPEKVAASVTRAFA